jgi:hypothetical protein
MLAEGGVNDELSRINNRMTSYSPSDWGSSPTQAAGEPFLGRKGQISGVNGDFWVFAANSENGTSPWTGTGDAWITSRAKVGDVTRSVQIKATPKASDSGGATVQPNFSNLNSGYVGYCRFRNIFDRNPGAGDIYVGAGDQGYAENRVETSAHKWVASQNFSWTYDPASDRLLATLGSQSLTYTGFMAKAQVRSSAFLFGAPWNAMHINVLVRDAPLFMRMTNVTLNGVALPISTFDSVYNTSQVWQVWGDFRKAFTITGTIELTGSVIGNSQEFSRIEIAFGHDSRATTGSPGGMVYRGDVWKEGY